jgi:hypothetical protein
MSIDRNPNINIAGLTTDIIQSIERYKRGAMAEVGMGEILGMISRDIEHFCIKVSSKFDYFYGVPVADPSETRAPEDELPKGEG